MNKSCNFILTVNNPDVDHIQAMDKVKQQGFTWYRG